MTTYNVTILGTTTPQTEAELMKDENGIPHILYVVRMANNLGMGPVTIEVAE